MKLISWQLLEKLLKRTGTLIFQNEKYPRNFNTYFFPKEGAPQWHELWREERNHFAQPMYKPHQYGVDRLG